MLLLIGPLTAHAVQISFSPASNQAGPGDTVTVSVQADQVSDLGGFQFNFSFDPALLQANSITVNNGFDQQFKKEFDNIAGKGIVAAFALNNPSMTVTNLQLADITFTIIGQGTANVGLSNVILGKIGGEEIASTSAGGVINIVSSQAMTVTLTKGGTISAPGLACNGNTCTGTYSVNEQVTLTPVPDPGYVFTGWSGACTGTGPCNVTMDQTQTVTANFYRTLAPLAYISNNTDGTVSVIDTSADKNIATITVGSGPAGVAVSPSGQRVYVANHLSETVSVINSLTNSVVDNLLVEGRPYGLAVSPDGSRVYAALVRSNRVAVIDAPNNTILPYIPVGTMPVGIALNPSGTRAYVANSQDNTVSVINTVSKTVIATITVGLTPHGVAVNPSGTKVYVSNYSDGTVSVIDTVSNAVDTLSVGGNPFGVAVDSSGGKIYVADDGSDSALVIDALDNSILNIAVGNRPQGAAISPSGERVYTSNYGSNTVSVIDTASNTVVASVDAGGGPHSFGAFIGPNPNQCAPEPSGLAAWWTGDGDADDIVGNNSGTFRNNATTVPGMVWRAFSFDGVDQYVEKLSPSGVLNIGNQSWAISAWVKTSYSGANAQYIVSRYQCGWDCSQQPNAGARYELYISGSGTAGFSVRQTANGSSFGPDNVLTVSDSANMRDGQWHLITGVLDRDAAEVRIFVDGQLRNSATAVGLGPIDDTGSPLEIGRQFRQGWASPDFYFNGLIDEVQIYNHALTSGEIAAIYNAGSSGVCGLSDITVSPALKNFGDVNVNATSVKQIFTFTNTGTGDLTVDSGGLLQGGDNGMFNVVPGASNPCPTPPFIVPTGLSCTLDVTFRPTSAGSKSATLRIVSDDPNMPNLDIPLTGRGAKAAATVTLGNLAQTYDRTVRSATVTTAPTGLAVDVLYNGSQTLPIHAGSYTVVAVINDPAYEGSATETLVINPRPITVKAVAGSKKLGAADPALTYQIISGSLINEDVFSGGLSRTAGETVGIYAINQETLSAGSNYNLTYVGANFQIRLYYTITKTANGLITSSPADLICLPGATSCVGEIPVNTTVTLSFKPVPLKKLVSVAINGLRLGPARSLTLKNLKKPPVVTATFSP